MSERVLMKGNEALAEAAIRNGCRHFFGYPITPQTELAAYMSKRMPKIGGTYLQAESEIAAANMVLGAASAGVRAMTSSSSPGISLKTEAISYMCGSDLPCLIVNVQRGGPGLGGIQASQADYWQATKAPGHGDLHILVFAPCSVQEMVDLVGKAFALADQYRMPAMILADGMLGQMMEPVVLCEPGEVQMVEKPWAVTGHGGRRPHNIVNSLFLTPDELERTVKERFERYRKIEKTEALAENYMTDDADYVIVSYGACARIAKSAVLAAREKGVKVGLVRPLTLWPFPKQDLIKAAEHAKEFLCVEMSMGQMVDDVRLAISCSRPVSFFGHTGGIIPTPAEILAEIEKMAGGNA
ncbi:MAG: 3-methyl-2-oxobutanoate dehydrogenase subunit VorB [Oscillospiraceae bacterium]|jgi:2-oxoglutarate ferredoxin oxidoreductase subunit alpha|nr:3-methyl-2-oxobutanoate dehydrogenase subunit VorB [Oscillospiraceae bacterium]